MHPAAAIVFRESPTSSIIHLSRVYIYIHTYKPLDSRAPPRTGHAKLVLATLCGPSPSFSFTLSYYILLERITSRARAGEPVQIVASVTAAAKAKAVCVCMRSRLIILFFGGHRRIVAERNNRLVNCVGARFRERVFFFFFAHRNYKSKENFNYERACVRSRSEIKKNHV